MTGGRLPGAPAAAGPDADLLEELSRWASRFEFEEAAVLVNIPQVPLDLLDPVVARNRGFFAYPPHALLYLGACFRELGIPHEIVDLNYVALRAAQEEHPDIRGLCQAKVREAIGRRRRPLVCVSFMFDATLPAFRDTCRFIKAEFPDLCLATGGVSATADPEAVLKEGLADVVFCNEGEQVLDGFYRFLRGRRDEPPVNTVFIDSKGAVRRTPLVSGGPVDVDIRPEYDLIPITHYHKAGSISNFSRMNGLEVPFSPVLAKRGCRAFCAFCGVRNFNGKGVRLRGYKDVVDEMVMLREKHGIEHFDWLDDDLLNDKKETLKLFDEMARRLPGITWASNNGLIANAVDDDVYQGLRRSGCIGFKVGLESGNAEILKKVHKPANVKQFLNFARRAQAYPDIFVAVNFILGLPEERFGQMLDSLSVAVQSRLHWHNFYIYQHIKNTEFYLTYGSMGEGFNSKEHGKENQGPTLERARPWVGTDPKDTALNPARGGMFRDFRLSEGTPSGYAVFDIDPGAVPARSWVREIWFTFNTVANFLLNPCLRLESEVMARGMVKWLDVLGKAYPEDALMACTNYYLKRRLGSCPRSELDEARSSAAALLRSPYWSFRDRQFGFSSFLDMKLPELPVRLRRLHGLQERGPEPE